MKKILLGFVGAFALFVLVVVGIAMTKPENFTISRGTMINAPPENAFNLVNNFRRWPMWSSWEKKDPNSKRTYEGPEEGVGAVYGWSGNNEVGEGKMTIVESVPPSKVRLKLEFIKPMPGEADTEITFQGAGPHTIVTWTMKGHSNFLGRIMCVFMDMDKMVGGDFEKGLAAMKAVAEGRPQ